MPVGSGTGDRLEIDDLSQWSEYQALIPRLRLPTLLGIFEQSDIPDDTNTHRKWVRIKEIKQNIFLFIAFVYL